MNLSLDERQIVTDYLAEQLRENKFTVKVNKYGSITRVIKSNIVCIPSLCDSAREGKNSFTFIQLEAGRYSVKDLGFYQEARSILTKYSAYNESAVDMRNYKRRVQTFVEELNNVYLSIVKTEELKESSDMDDIEFLNINNQKISLHQEDAEKIARLYWEKDEERALKYLSNFNSDILREFNKRLADKLSYEGYDSDFDWENANSQEHMFLYDTKNKVFFELIEELGLDNVIEEITNYMGDLIDFDDVETLLSNDSPVEEKLVEDNDVVSIEDEVSLVPIESSGLVDWVIDELVNELGNDYGDYEYDEEHSSEPDSLMFTVEDTADEYANCDILVLTDAEADAKQDEEIRSYVEDLLPDMLESGSIDIEDFLNEDWFDDYRKDWYEEYVYSMTDEELINDMIECNIINDNFSIDDIIVMEDDEIDISATADNLGSDYRERDKAIEALLDYYCNIYSSSIDWYLDYIGSHDLKYLVRDNPDAFDSEAYERYLSNSSYSRGEWISHYDGGERYLGSYDNVAYYAYIL